MKKINWTDVKQELSSQSPKELIDLIKDLYQANKENQQFLYTRYGLSSDSLASYKETIEQFVNPNPMSDEYCSIAKAKKAISNYKKALGNPQGVVELEVYFCECAAYSIDNYCMDDESYFSSFEKMFERAIKSIKKLEQNKQLRYLKRLEIIYILSDNWGWGIFDELSEILNELDIQFTDI